MKSIAIISCGAEKLEGVHKAADLYVGSFFKGNLKAAIAEFGIDNVFILSAKYGLVHASQEIESYNVKMGDEGSISIIELAHQIKELGLDETEAYAFCPKAYWSVLSIAGSFNFWYPQWVNEADAGIGYMAKTACIVSKI